MDVVHFDTYEHYRRLDMEQQILDDKWDAAKEIVERWESELQNTNYIEDLDYSLVDVEFLVNENKTREDVLMTLALEETDQ